MFAKVDLFNIALQALLINYQVIDADNDSTKEAKTLRLMYPIALSQALADMDLDRTATIYKLELLADKKHPLWTYVYKYPATCAKFRRITSPFPQDNEETRIPAQTTSIDGVAVIVTNEPTAYAEIIGNDINLSLLNPSAALAVGHYLAYLSTSLLTGKGAVDTKKSIFDTYVMHKAEAIDTDQNENVDTTPDEFESKFVSARVGGRGWHLKT